MLPRKFSRRSDCDIHNLDAMCSEHKRLRNSARFTMIPCLLTGQMCGLFAVFFAMLYYQNSWPAVSPFILGTSVSCFALSSTALLLGVAPSKTGASRAQLGLSFSLSLVVLGVFSCYLDVIPGLPKLFSQSASWPVCLGFLLAAVVLRFFSARLAHSALEFDRKTQRLNELWYLREYGLLESES